MSNILINRNKKETYREYQKRMYMFKKFNYSNWTLLLEYKYRNEGGYHGQEVI